MPAKVLVAFASKHGSTRGIAHAIGGALHARGYEVRVLPAAVVRSLDGFDAVVVGSAVYHDQWLWDGRRMLRRVRTQLDARPTWLFSSGPVGGTPEGDRLLDTACGPHTDVLPTLSKALAGLHVLGHATFPGKVSERASGMFEREVPRGDWRSFREVVSWGRMVGEEIADVTDLRRSPRIRRA